MIEVLDPAADWLRIESLLDSGISLVNAWEAALPELASLDLPHLSPRAPACSVNVRFCPSRGRGGRGLRRGWCGRAGLRGRAGNQRL
jgi:hypothetical protein